MSEVQTGEITRSFIDRLNRAFLQETEERDFYEVVPRMLTIDKTWNLWRLDKSGVRYYFNPNNDEFYPSTTSIVWHTMKESSYLNDWKLKMAVENNDPNAPNTYMNERASYGTLMHILFTEAMLFGRVHTDQIEGAVMMYQDIFNLGHINVRPWINELKSDLSSFFEWMKIYDIVPVAVEIPIYYPVSMKIQITNDIDPILWQIGWVAGTIDLIAEMWAGKGGKEITPRTPMNNRERVLSVIDYKSGKKGFYESHKIQVNSYMRGWNWIQHSFLGGNYPIRRCYNFAPSSGRTEKATFKFDNQTGAVEYEKYPHLLAQFIIDGKHEVPDIRYVDGEFEIGRSGSESVHLVSARDYIKQKYDKTEE